MVIALDYENEIHYAMAFNLPMRITTIQVVVIGNAHYIDSLNNQVRLKDDNQIVYNINIVDIVNVEIME